MDLHWIRYWGTWQVSGIKPPGQGLPLSPQSRPVAAAGSLQRAAHEQILPPAARLPVTLTVFKL